MASGIGPSSGTRAAAPSQPRPPATPVAQDDFEEISLVDIVRVLHRRRVVLASIIVLALVGGVALTLFTAPEYEASATIIPLEHDTIIKSWLGSRQAASEAATATGGRLLGELYPDDWDETTGTWRDVPRTDEQVSLALAKHVKVSGGAKSGEILSIKVNFGDAGLARDVATAYILGLDELRPQLENITRSELFDKYYDGTNAVEAQGRAERAAAEKSYWIVFDSPTLPEAPSKPRPVLNMALAGVLGVMGGVFVVFGLEWLDKYRADFKRVEPPRSQ